MQTRFSFSHLAGGAGRATLTFAVAAVLLGGCSMASETNQQLDEGAHAPGRTRDMAKAVETDSNINQINQALGMAKGDNDGKPFATIEEAKKAARVPDSMWIDGETGKPLVYDSATGTVHRAGAAADSPASAGSSNAPGALKGMGGAGAGGNGG